MYFEAFDQESFEIQYLHSILTIAVTLIKFRKIGIRTNSIIIIIEM